MHSGFDVSSTQKRPISVFCTQKRPICVSCTAKRPISVVSTQTKPVCFFWKETYLCLLKRDLSVSLHNGFDDFCNQKRPICVFDSSRSLLRKRPVWVLHTHTQIQLFGALYILTCARKHTHARTHTHTLTHSHTCTHAHMQTRTHTHTHSG